MKLVFMTSLLLSSLLMAVAPGKMAPDFELMNHKGEKVKLSSMKGKYVVLEWYNQGCPFVRKHYDVNNMQKIQASSTAKKFLPKNEVVWLSIVSSAEGKQGYLADAAAAMKQYKDDKFASSHLLLDHDGKVGKAYGAKTTPHMYIIDPEMKLVYMGAIDSNSSYDSETIKDAKNYITLAMNDIKEGRKIALAETKPYGCSVKYK